MNLKLLMDLQVVETVLPRSGFVLDLRVQVSKILPTITVQRKTHIRQLFMKYAYLYPQKISLDSQTESIIFVRLVKKKTFQLQNVQN